MGLFPSKDMHTCPPLRSGHIWMKDAHNTESIEKLIFRFLFSKLWLIVFTLFTGDTPYFPSVSPTKKKITAVKADKFT